MTQKNKIIKHVADVIGILIGWVTFYILTVVVCAFMEWNLMEETLTPPPLSLYALWRVLDLSDKFEG